MGPYVIDQKKRQEYFLFLVFFIVLSFALGYFFGYQSGQKKSGANAHQLPSVLHSKKTKDLKAVTVSKAGNKKKDNSPGIKPVQIKKEATGKKDNKKINKKVIKISSTKKISEKNKKDKPKIKSNNTKSKKSTAQSEIKNNKKIAIPIKIENKTDEKKEKQSVFEGQQKNPVELAPSITSSKDTEAKVESQNFSAKKDIKTVIPNNESKAESNNRPLKSYSVQVGMFASKSNAEKFVNRLKDSGFDAYLEDFILASGAKKYNVRLGPYVEKVLARDNMSLYKQSYSTPAYIINK